MPAGHEIKRLRAHVPADRRLSFLNEAELHLMCKKDDRMQSEDAVQRMQCEDVEDVEDVGNADDVDDVVPSSP